MKKSKNFKIGIFFILGLLLLFAFMWFSSIEYILSGNISPPTEIDWDGLQDKKDEANKSDYKGINYENYSDMLINELKYTRAQTTLMNIIIVELANGKGIDTTFAKNVMFHYSVLGLLEDKKSQDRILNLKENFDCYIDSLYVEYMTSIDYIYCHTKQDSIETDSSDLTKSNQKFLNNLLNHKKL